MYQTELINKNQKLRQVEDDHSALRIHSGQYESKIVSAQGEVLELQSAMASLHGELSVLQKEYSDLQLQQLTNKKLFEQNLQELCHKAQQEKEPLVKKTENLEQQLVEARTQYQLMNDENHERIKSLLEEREELEKSVMKKELANKQQLVTNQELNGMLGKVHHDLMTRQEEYREREENLTQQVLSSEMRVKELEEKMVMKDDTLEKLNRLVHEMKKENENYISENGQQKVRMEQMMSEQKKSVKRCERFEAEKEEMLIEITTLVRAKETVLEEISEKNLTIKELNDKILVLMKQQKEHEVSARERETEMRQLSLNTSERNEHIVTLERQLNEEIQLKEQLLETSKIQNKENTTRIIDLTSKNSKLTSDVTILQDEIIQLKRQLEDVCHEKISYQNQCDEIMIKKQGLETRIQELEDLHEEYSAKILSSETELFEQKEEMKQLIQKHEKEYEESSTQHLEAIEELEKKYLNQMNEMSRTHTQQLNQYEINYNKNILNIKENFLKQFNENNLIKLKELNDYKNRIASLGTAMEELQKELKYENQKNYSLRNEMNSLRELVENNGNDKEERFIKQEKDRILERQRTENMMYELKEDTHRLQNELQQNIQNISLIEHELVTEKELKNKLISTLKKAEEKARNSELTIETQREEIGILKRQLKENERKMMSQINMKDEEIQRLTRRNEVLSEAVARMTQVSSGTPGGGAGGGGQVLTGGEDYGFQNTNKVSSYGSASPSTGGGNGVLSYEQYTRQQSVLKAPQGQGQQPLQRDREQGVSSIPDRIHDGRFMNPTDKPMVSPISLQAAVSMSSVGRGGVGASTPLSPMRQGDDGGLEENSFQAVRLTAPSPREPPGQYSQLQPPASPLSCSTKPALRSISATARTVEQPQPSYSNSQALSSQQVRSNYLAQKSVNSNEGGEYGFPISSSAGGGTQHLSNEEVTASLSRVQRAIDSRRSHSTPRGGSSSSRATSAPVTSSMSNLDGERDTITTAPAAAVGERALPIRAEYDSSYASSAAAVYQREIFSPKRQGTPDGLLSPSLARKQTSQRVPTLDMEEYHHSQAQTQGLHQQYSSSPFLPGRDEEEAEEEDEAALPSHRSLNSRGSTGSGGGGGSSNGSYGNYSQKIRNEIETVSKEQLLPYSPQKSHRGNSHGLKQQSSERHGGGSETTPLRSKESTRGGTGVGGGGGHGKPSSSTPSSSGSGSGSKDKTKTPLQRSASSASSSAVTHSPSPSVSLSTADRTTTRTKKSK
jgi:hypothetical protein